MSKKREELGVGYEYAPFEDGDPARGGFAAGCAKFKAGADWCAAALLMIVAVPIIAVLALAVKAASPGPAFYTQVRIGYRGRLFRICKLRTMVHNCEAATGPVWASANDSRVTWIGRILRDTHLDELPQLWNILRGEMSLIGPRPERPEIAARIEAAIPGFHRRLWVKPGLTGLAQLRLPPDTDIAGVRLKLAQDLHYVRHKGVLMDARILISTALHFAGTGCTCASRLALTSIPSERQAPQAAPARPTLVVETPPRTTELASNLSAAA